MAGVVEYLILGESGRRAADGNFGWGMMGAALMLWVVMLPRFLRDIRERGKPSPAHWAGLGLLLWHLGLRRLLSLLSGHVRQCALSAALLRQAAASRYSASPLAMASAIFR